LQIVWDWGILGSEESMAKVSLRAYDREIEGLIEHGQRVDEAIAHCRHILQTYPKHLDTYRLLGKAYLEAKRYQQAVDIFERVLVVAPEDFVSHVGMSIITDDQNRLDDAIWHMERAFEMQPSNAAIQGELQRLFGRRDGVEPPKIRLTRGALARMYMQGELYSQAISEIKVVLGSDPKRADMQALLARAYYGAGQKTEAATICTDLLGRFTYCLDSNRLMVEILTGTQRAEAAQEYRQRVFELDPYAAFAQDSLAQSENVADGAVSLERLEYSGRPGEASLPLAIGLEAEPQRMSGGTSEPDWLSGSRAPSGSPPTGLEQPDEIPAFLRRGGWAEKSADAEPAATPIKQEDNSVPEAVPGDLPAWVRALAPAEDAEPDPGPVPDPGGKPDWLQDLGPSSSREANAAPAAAANSDVPDWLKDLSGHDLDEPAPKMPTSTYNEEPAAVAEASDTPAEESPTWLKDFATDLESPLRKAPTARLKPAAPPAETKAPSDIGALGTSSQEQDDAMAWLESLAAKHGAAPEELVTDPNARTGVVPDWVDKAREIADESPEVLPTQNSMTGQEAEPSSLDLTGAWLRDLGVAESGRRATTDTPSKPFDWLSGLSEEAGFGAVSRPAENPEKPKMHAQDAPAWLSADSAESQTPESAPAVDLPGWLAGLDNEEPSAPPTARSQEDVPPWLRGDSEAQPQTAKPTQPADWRPAAPPERTEINPVPALDTPVSAEGPVAQPRAGEGLAPAADRLAVAPRPKPAAAAPKPAGPLTTSLEGAQAELGRGNIAAALDLYEKMIRKGKSLEDIIRDLRDALYRYPVEVSIWQALGDAYMRANRLQEALDAYTKAEELLR
jgi:tetratricopeptide (TPR) repeat protein